MTYSIDTSALLDYWVRMLRPSYAVTFWELMDNAIREGVLIASEEVFQEIERKEDELLEWVSERKDMFVPITDDVQANVVEIMAQFPKLVDERTGKSFADPFVIATAMVADATVVTGEDKGTPKRPRIPIVCEHFGVECIQSIDFIEKQGWKF